jgi:hypothetical protein
LNFFQPLVAPGEARGPAVPAGPRKDATLTRPRDDGLLPAYTGRLNILMAFPLMMSSFSSAVMSRASMEVMDVDVEDHLDSGCCAARNILLLKVI